MNAPVAVVTGANSGIGRATAIYLATKGMRVFGTVRDASKATKLLAGAADAGVIVEIAELDVADDESVKRGFADILARAGGVDLLVNNAGIGGNAVAEECPPSFYHEVMNVNLYGVIRCVQEVLPGMRERKRGCIVNISSIVGKFAAIGQSPYVASKFALEGVSDGMAQELAPFNIRVAVVEPEEIDRINILQATWEGMRRAALGLLPVPDAALIDGKPVKQYPLHQVALVKGDSLSYSIAAASIIAKVTRDRFMVALAQQHPEYGFEIHKGYPTPAHLAALKKHGPCPQHRRSFRPMAQVELDLA